MWLFLLVSAGIALWVTFRVYTGTCLEDALITFRYAENLALGNGFVFNVGERVLGTTTPLQALVLALLALIFGTSNIGLLSNVAMALSNVGTAILTYAILRRAGYSERVGLLAVLLFMFHPIVVWSTMGGMETPLVLLFMAGSLYASMTEQWRLMGILCGLLVLARIDAALWSGGLALLVWIRYRAPILPVFLPAFIIVGTWFAFAFAYFGNPLPHSMIAKTFRLPGAQAISGVDVAIIPKYLKWFGGGLGLTPQGGPLLLVFVAWLALVGIGALRIARKHRAQSFFFLIVFPFIFCIAYILGRAPQFKWYVIPLTWCSLIFVTLGIRVVWLWLRRLVAHRTSVRTFVNGALVIAVVGAGLGWLQVTRNMFEHRRQFQANENARGGIGDWIRENSPEDASVAMEAIGYQGTRSRRRVIDLAGLVSPEVVRIRRESTSNSEVFHRILTELAPDYLILRSYEVDENRYRDGGPTFASEAEKAYFFSTFEEDHRFTLPYTDLWGESAYLTLYRRR